jgi:hypothetical protein
MNDSKATIFTRNGFTYLVIGACSVMIIGYRNTKKETTLEIPQTVKYQGLEYRVRKIGYRAFYRCEFKNVIAYSIDEVCESAFECSMNLETVNFHWGIVEIRRLAFYGCRNLIEVSGCENTERVESDAFGYCPQLEKVSLPETLKYAGVHIFGDSPKIKIQYKIGNNSIAEQIA